MSKQLVNQMGVSRLIQEYKLVLQKKSKLGRSARDLVESKIAKLHKDGKVTIQQLRINNNQI